MLYTKYINSVPSIKLNELFNQLPVTRTQHTLAVFVVCSRGL